MLTHATQLATDERVTGAAAAAAVSSMDAESLLPPIGGPKTFIGITKKFAFMGWFGPPPPPRNTQHLNNISVCDRSRLGVPLATTPPRSSTD
jgi:hypothetical protein